MLTVRIGEFKPSVTIVADEHPIVNDDDYCEVITTPPALDFTCNGTHLRTVGEANESRDDLIAKIPSMVAYDEWFERHWSDSFSDHGLDAPVVYDYEEDRTYAVTSIDNYVNNCYWDENYESVIRELKALALKEIEVVIIDDG